MSSFNAFPTDWHVKEIMNADITIIDGDRGANYPSKEEFANEGYCLFLNTGNIKSDCFDFSSCDFISENKDALLRKGKLRRKDVVLTTRGTVGSVGYFHNNISYEHIRINSGMVVLRCAESVVPEYSYHLFKSPLLKTQYSLYSSGAAQPQLPIKDLKRIKLPIPPITVQRKIAAILTAYDELIENNQRRIALLEKMAEEIYREWFVCLRFPGHNKVKVIKGVPDGWQVKKLGELVRTQYGYTASAETEGEGPKFLRITDIVPAAINWALVPHCKIEEKDKEKYLLQEGDIVVARTGATVGYAKRINKQLPEAVFASYLVRLIPKRKCDAIYLGLSVERNAFKDFIWMFVTGAAQPQANATTMALFPVFYPPEPLLNEFNRIVEPMLDEKEFLLNQIAVLSRTRDMLLPRLISGKLSVENLDIQFPPSMEETAHEI